MDSNTQQQTNPEALIDAAFEATQGQRSEQDVMIVQAYQLKRSLIAAINPVMSETLDTFMENTTSKAHPVMMGLAMFAADLLANLSDNLIEQGIADRSEALGYIEAICNDAKANVPEDEDPSDDAPHS